MPMTAAMHALGAAGGGSAVAAQWVSGLATFAAVGVAAGALLDERRRHRAELKAMEAGHEAERAQWNREYEERLEANRVRAVSGVVAYAAPDYDEIADVSRPGRLGRVQTGWSLVIRNGSLDPLLRWHVLVQHGERIVAELCWLDNGMIPPASVAAPDERFDISEALSPSPLALTTTLDFEDVEGRRWRRGSSALHVVPDDDDCCCSRHAASPVGT